MDFSYNFLETTYLAPDVLQISLNRPDLHNAFNEELIAELTDIGLKLQSSSDIRIVILTGNGKSFCAGADLNWMKKSKNFSYDENMQDSLNLGKMFHTLDELPQAVIGKINGSAIGGGTGLVSICDISIGIERAKFGFSEVNLGLLPAVISPFIINKIDFRNAREFFLTGERFTAQTAHSIGLLNYVVKTEDELSEKVIYLINEIYTSGPAAVKEIKKLIKELRNFDMVKVLNLTAKKIATIRTSSEAQEGISSFLEKRKPLWFKNI